jgi:pimeloyl-ACP methyl ester carboxylesterase
MCAFLLTSTLFTFCPPTAQAQTRYAAFAHGLTFGDDRPSATDQSLQEVRSNKASRWEASGTPENWKDTDVISDFIFLRYFDRDLYDGNRDKTLDASRTAMMERFVQQMRDKTQGVSNAEWVLVGHSQGGIVVRLLYKYIQKNHPDIEVAGVLAAGSPLQGARAARMAFSPSRSNYYDVASEMTHFIQDILRGPLAETLETAVARVGFSPYGGNRWIELGANFVDYYGSVADVISRGIVEAEIEDKIDAISHDKRAAAAIGPDGYLIEKINSGPRPDNYRSLIGAERSPIPARVGSGALTDRPLGLSWLPPSLISTGALASNQGFEDLGFLLIGTGASVPSEIAPGNEPQTVRFYYKVMSLYNLLEQYHDSRQGPPLYSECWDGDGYNPCVLEDRWNKGHDALKAFPSTYSEIIDSYQLESRTGYRTVCPNTYGDGTTHRSEHRFSPPSAKKYVDHNLEPPDNDDPSDGQQDDDDGVPGNECYEEAYTYYVTVPDESDGIVSVQTGVWNEGDSPNDRTHNFLFGNDGGSAEQTGFNHAELIYNERRYNSSSDPDPYSVSFNAGDNNPPMENAEDWVFRAFRQ